MTGSSGIGLMNCGSIRASIGRYRLGYLPKKPTVDSVPLYVAVAPTTVSLPIRGLPQVSGPSGEVSVSIDHIREACSGLGVAVYVAPNFLFPSIEQTFKRAGRTFEEDWKQYRFPVVFTPGLIVVNEAISQEEGTELIPRIAFDLPMTAAGSRDLAAFTGGVARADIKQGLGAAVFTSSFWISIGEDGELVPAFVPECGFNYVISHSLGRIKLRSLLAQSGQRMSRFSQEAILYYALSYQLGLADALSGVREAFAFCEMTHEQNERVIRDDLLPFMDSAEAEYIRSLCRQSLPPAFASN